MNIKLLFLGTILSSYDLYAMDTHLMKVINSAGTAGPRINMDSLPHMLPFPGYLRGNSHHFLITVYWRGKMDVVMNHASISVLLGVPLIRHLC